MWYGSHDDLACAIVELFGDTRLVSLSPLRLARPVVDRTLKLLDLRHNGAMLAGTVAEIAKTGDARATWGWARYFYDQQIVYGDPDGLIWLGAHNDGDCIVLFEQGRRSLSCDRCSVPLAHPALRDVILSATSKHRLMLAL